jgi:hypothetical protein
MDNNTELSEPFALVTVWRMNEWMNAVGASKM